MTRRLPVERAPGPLEEYASRLDDPSALAPSANASGATWRACCSPNATRPLPPLRTTSRGRGTAQRSTELAMVPLGVRVEPPGG